MGASLICVCERKAYLEKQRGCEEKLHERLKQKPSDL